MLLSYYNGSAGVIRSLKKKIGEGDYLLEREGETNRSIPNSYRRTKEKLVTSYIIITIL